MSEHSETLKVLSEILEALNLIASRLDTAEDVQDDESLEPEPRLGILSERYESNGDPAAIGLDRVGGYSYGQYQIATKTGTMATFIDFLEEEYPFFYSILNDAGGNMAATNGTDEFKATWRRLAKNRSFVDVQHYFIKATHYNPFVLKVYRESGIDINKRSLALRNVAWSVAVQHGPQSNVFKKALLSIHHGAASMLLDVDIINAVYDERSKVERYFRSSSPRVQASVKRRFVKECEEALAMLEGETRNA